MIFIDGGNLYHGLKHNTQTTALDYEKFAQMLCGDRMLTRVRFYHVMPDQSRDLEGYRKQRVFLAYLEKIPYVSACLGHLVSRGCGQIEKGVDVALAVDMVRMAATNAYDTAVLVSGDGDFGPAVTAVQDTFGKHVENAYFSRGSSHRLRQLADRFVRLDRSSLRGCLKE